MRFDVPQFIDVEDKIFGPLTFRQFVYLLGGGGAVYILTQIMPLFMALIIGVPIAGFAFALAFYKINNRPFINIVESAFIFFVRDKLYIWKKGERKKNTKKETKKIERKNIPMISGSKLHDVAWGLDVLNSKKTK